MLKRYRKHSVYAIAILFICIFISSKADTLYIPENVKEIKEEAFFGDESLGYVVLPNGIEIIGAKAFAESTLTQINLPESLKSIEVDAIPKYTHIKASRETWIYDWAIENGFYVIDDTEYAESPLDWFTFVDNGDGTCTLKFYDGPLPNSEDIVIPSKDSNGLTVTKIADVAFSTGRFTEENNVTGRLIIPETVKSIGNSTFCQTQFTGDLIIPDSVISIGSYAFFNCPGFNGRLVIGNQVQEIGKSAFGRCKNLTGSLIIPNSVGSIETFTFSGCNNLTGDLIIGDGVKLIGRMAFSDCNFHGLLKLGKELETIDEEAFYNSGSLTGDLIIPDSVKRIKYAAFANCSSFDGQIIIGKGVFDIGQEAFMNCSGLSGSLNIPESVCFIGAHAFKGCNGLNGDIIVHGNPSFSDGAFDECVFSGNLVLLGASLSTDFCNGQEIKDLYIKDVYIYGDKPFSGTIVENIYCVITSSAWKWFEDHGYADKLVSWDGDISKIV